MSTTAIKICDISKAYYSYQKPRHRLQEMLRPVLGRVHRRFDRPYAEEFWALKDISFEVGRGESLGIIGRNGAGKSTLLQIIAGTLTPTSGNVKVSGRINALLELGSGFNPEFSGIENVYMNGAILGFSKEEIDAKLDRILAFADIGSFVYQPVKTYSSGMFVRLAFAVQALLEPEILVVDEALSVGDFMFQQKCHRMIQTLIETNKTTLLFVSHDLGSIQKYCRTSILLHQGRMIGMGDSVQICGMYYSMARWLSLGSIDSSADNVAERFLDYYNEARNEAERKEEMPARQAWNQVSLGSMVTGDFEKVVCLDFRYCNSAGGAVHSIETGDWLTIFVRFIARENCGAPLAGISVSSVNNIHFFSRLAFQFESVEIPEKMMKGDILEVKFAVKMDVYPGKYAIRASFAEISFDQLKIISEMDEQFIRSSILNHFTVTLSEFLVTERRKGLAIPFFGHANLEGTCDYLKGEAQNETD